MTTWGSGRSHIGHAIRLYTTIGVLFGSVFASSCSPGAKEAPDRWSAKDAWPPIASVLATELAWRAQSWEMERKLNARTMGTGTAKADTLRQVIEKDRAIEFYALAKATGVNADEVSREPWDNANIVASFRARLKPPTDDGCGLIANLVAELGQSCERVAAVFAIVWDLAGNEAHDLSYLNWNRAVKACGSLVSSFKVTESAAVLFNHSRDLLLTRHNAICMDLSKEITNDLQEMQAWNETAFAALSPAYEAAREFVAALPDRCRPDGLEMTRFCRLEPSFGRAIP